MTEPKFNLNCPVPNSDHEQILMAHGGGGRLMQKLLEQSIMPGIENPMLGKRHDASVFEIGKQRLAFTTDSFVVSPLFFPGGDIGKLAVCGTVNDLAMAGATPLYLSLALIIEEGLPIDILRKVMDSVSVTAKSCGVQIITGDTKVVERGKGDGIYINTAGIGILEHSMTITPAQVQAGDAIILSGDIGRHGMAIMAQRENLQFESTIQSDCAPLNAAVASLVQSGIEIHCLRDLTRGGLASALVEISQASRLNFELDERLIPVSEPVRASCELLGLDPLHVANEGRFITFVPKSQASNTVEILNHHESDFEAVVIGNASHNSNGQVIMNSLIGGRRVIEMLSGEQLPRIC